MYSCLALRLGYGPERDAFCAYFDDTIFASTLAKGDWCRSCGQNHFSGDWGPNFVPEFQGRAGGRVGAGWDSKSKDLGKGKGPKGAGEPKGVHHWEEPAGANWWENYQDNSQD